ncbi:hypothetical protein BBF96_09795 [Anoxybacter fermentans]|uniref:Uncharacterized protein n=1 Tax=Anoxybacter fermentans TaxID=1323375 RepID=A0A3S9SZR3_9FIRM|nr:hypothetical protein [Anoxybacter fermentans]AZR73652.1 hypothetical protein BBF96_09795 [Anoxybacter fermentans]
MPERDNQSPPRPKIFSDEFIAQIGKDLANQIIDQICQGLTQMVPSQKPTSLCLELLVFELDEDILKKLVKCVFNQFNPVQITQKILEIINRVNNVMNKNENLTYKNKKKFQIDKFNLLRKVNRKIKDLKNTLFRTCTNLRDNIFKEILLRPKQIPSDKLTDISFIIEHVIIQHFRQFLIDQYDNFALKLCNKVSCIFSDLEFLAEQIKQITINFPSSEVGIIEIADAAATVAEAFFSEEDDFNKIFDAVDEVAELIEDLAQFYQKKLDQLEKLLALSTSGCPVPIEAVETLPTIPEVPPPSPIFSIVEIPGTATTPFFSP